MKPRHFTLAGLAIVFAMQACRPSANVAQAQGPDPEMWVWLASHLNNDANLKATEKAIDEASSYGYNGIAFWDVSFIMLNSPNWGDPQGEYPKKAMNYAAAKGMKVAALGAPFGYSNEALIEHPEWAEPQRIVGARYRVSADKKKLEIVNSFEGLVNGGFEGGRTAWFEKNDRGVGLDESVAHVGKASGLIRNAPDNGRFLQRIKLTPWRQYHIRLFAKTDNFKGAASVMVLDTGNTEKVRYSGNIEMNPSQDWTEFNAIFNSQGSSDANLYLGEWGGAQGAVWFDDVSLEESGPVHLIRRDGAPFRIYDPANGSDFQEGKDYAHVADPHPLGEPLTAYHAPIEIAVPPSSRLTAGQTVAIDYYAAQPISPPGEFGMCLTAAGVQKWLAENARKVVDISPAQGGVFLQYDEVRHLNSCALCKSKGMTAGQLLGWHVGETIKLYRASRAGFPIYVWSDMFDPFHNAHDNYFLAEGDLANSWRGLPADVTIMNWNPDHAAESLKWFSGRDAKQPIEYRQIVSAYVDGQNPEAVVRTRLGHGAGIPGIAGIMYTTWSRDYSKLKAFADAVRQKWPEYAASVK